MVVIEDFEVPKSCLRCTKRKCLHIDGKTYQMCGLNEDGYLTESWFNSKNLPKDRRSVHCPLREVDAIPKDQYEARLKADMVAMLTEIQTEIDEIDSREHACDFAAPYCIDRDDVVEIIQKKINKLKENKDEK